MPIFGPMRNGVGDQWGHGRKRNFVGYVYNIKPIMHAPKDVTCWDVVSEFLLISAMSGTGNSAMTVQATEHVRATKEVNKQSIILINVSHVTDSRMPFR